MFIKNHTPFIGKIKLKFEKFPHYSSGNNILNKIHLNLGFTKLVSRMEIKRGLNGDMVDPKKVEKICKYTGGKIAKYEWYEVKGVKGTFKSNVAPKIGRAHV